MTFSDAFVRYAEDRLMTGSELVALFAGIGIDPFDRPEPTQIVEATSVDCIPLAAARLAAKADGTRSETEWVLDALDLMEHVKTHHILYAGEPLPIEMRRAAVGMGLIADVSAGMIRQKMMPPLAPIVNRPITLAELYAAGGFDEQGKPITTRPE